MRQHLAHMRRLHLAASAERRQLGVAQRSLAAVADGIVRCYGEGGVRGGGGARSDGVGYKEWVVHIRRRVLQLRRRVKSRWT